MNGNWLQVTRNSNETFLKAQTVRVLFAVYLFDLVWSYITRALYRCVISTYCIRTHIFAHLSVCELKKQKQNRSYNAQKMCTKSNTAKECRSQANNWSGLIKPLNMHRKLLKWNELWTCDQKNFRSKKNSKGGKDCIEQIKLTRLHFLISNISNSYNNNTNDDDYDEDDDEAVKKLVLCLILPIPYILIDCSTLAYFDVFLLLLCYGLPRSIFGFQLKIRIVGVVYIIPIRLFR